MTGGSSSYSLSLASVAGTPYDGAGGTYGTARQLTVGSTTQTFRDNISNIDFDYYGFTLAPGQSLGVNLSGITGGGTQAIVSVNIDNHVGTNGGYAGTGADNTLVSGFQYYTFVTGSSGPLDATITNNNAFSQSYFLQLQGYTGASDYTLALMGDYLPKFTGGTRSVVAGDVIQGANLTNPSDGDGEAISQFRIMDGTADAGSGYFTVNGAQQQSGQEFTLNASDLGLLQFHGGTGPATDQVSMQGFDGRAWGLWWSWGIDTTVPDPGGNDYVSAQRVALSSTPQTFHDWVGDSGTSADIIDFYRFTVTNQSVVHVQLSGLTQGVTITPVNVIDDHSNGYTLNQEMSLGMNVTPAGVSSDLVNLASGDYAILVNRGGNPGTFYDITLSAS